MQPEPNWLGGLLVGASITALKSSFNMEQNDRAAMFAMERFGLVGQTAIVTGGSRGIGHAVVTELCRLGAKVLTCGRDPDTLGDALNDWKQKGLNVEGMVADVSTEVGRSALMHKAEDIFGSSLNILVNNAGMNIRKPTTEYTSKDFHDIMTTNLESAFALSQMAYEPLKASNGCIVMNSSVAGGPTSINTGTLYAMTKAAMNQMTRNLACEWAPAIRVNAVAPWYISTDLAQQVLQKEGYQTKVLNCTPFGRVGRCEEVAGVIAFLCSKAASYTTGQTVAIDGAAMISSFNY